MMRISALLFALMMISCSRPDITGQKKWSYWKNHCDWDDVSAAKYDVNMRDVHKLSSDIRTYNIEFVLFAGSWCDDSEREVPRLMKVLKMTGIDTDEMIVIGTDIGGKNPKAPIEKYKMDYSPTLIILSAGKEIGRIEEEPDNSWERDIWQIIRQHHV